MWKTILFDLDGTLTDPKEGITKAVAIALNRFGIREEPGNLTHFIGPPLDESLPEDLQAAGKRLLVATSKPEVTAVRVLEHFGMAQYFDHICGAPLDNQEGARKANVIRSALDWAGPGWDAGNTVMVGDRRHDVAGAHEVGLPCVGVLYGYGNRAEHEKAGAEFIVEDIPALRQLLLEDAK